MNSDLRSSVLARFLAAIYTYSGVSRRYRVAGILISIITRLEGGSQRSATARRLLDQHHGVSIGVHSYGPCFIPGWFPPKVEIGNYTSIAPGVRVVNENHPTNRLSTHPEFYKSGENRHVLIIGNDVWVGFNAIILPGCSRVGDGAVVGAGSVVTKDVPAYAIVGGNPAQLIRYRFAESVRKILQESRWWSGPLSEVRFKSAPDWPKF